MSCSPTAAGSYPPGDHRPLAPGWQPAKYTRAPKPTGGFALLPLEALVLPWLAYEQGVIETLALRGYLACIEMRERRCGAAPETPIVYTIEELRRLLGATVRPSTAAAVRQALVTGGLLTWPDDGHQVALCPQGTAVPWLDHARYTALRAAIHPSVQQIPLPRRLLTWLAAEGAPGLIATVLGVACRALRYRAHQVIAGGSLVPAWVATTFQIARRTVAHWLQHLRALGWLAPLATPPAHRAAYGPWLAVNLWWVPPGSARPGRTNLASRMPHKRTNLAIPRTNLATLTPQNTQEIPDISRTPGERARPHDNPLRDTHPFQHHKNLSGARTEGQGTASSGAAPAGHYATLPPDTQAQLYQSAEARLRTQMPAAFCIRPVVLAEVYRVLEIPLPRMQPPCITPEPGPTPLTPAAAPATPPPPGQMTRRRRAPCCPPQLPSLLQPSSPQETREADGTFPPPNAARREPPSVLGERPHAPYRLPPARPRFPRAPEPCRTLPPWIWRMSLASAPSGSTPRHAAGSGAVRPTG